MSPREAETAIHHGAIAAIVTGVLNLLVMVIAMAQNAQEGVMARFNDPWMLADVLVIFTLAHFIHRQSRFAAITIFLYFLASKIFLWSEAGRVSGLPLALLFLYFFGRAAWASIVLHRHRRQAGCLPPPRRGWAAALLSLGGVALVGLLALGLLFETGLFPDTAAVRGDEISPRALSALRARGLLAEGDEVLYFYADGAVSFLDDCSYFTRDHVVTHGEREGEEFHFSAHFKDVVDIALDDTVDVPGYTVIAVTTRDGDWFRLVVSTEGGGDREFFRALREQWRTRIEGRRA